MLTVYLTAAMLLVLAATRAPLARLAHVRIRHSWLLWLALADQVIIISVLPEAHPTVLAAAHIASYVAAGVCVVVNRHVAGVRLIGLGGALNGLVITLNGGMLPASEAALRTAGRAPEAGEFSNSGVLSDPRLPLLGDVFATPSWLPGHTVFSIGDIAIWLGIGWFLWRTCRPPVAPRHAAPRSRDVGARFARARPRGRRRPPAHGRLRFVNPM